MVFEWSRLLDCGVGQWTGIAEATLVGAEAISGATRMRDIARRWSEVGCSGGSEGHAGPAWDGKARAQNPDI